MASGYMASWEYIPPLPNPYFSFSKGEPEMLVAVYEEVGAMLLKALNILAENPTQPYTQVSLADHVCEQLKSSNTTKAQIIINTLVRTRVCDGAIAKTGGVASSIRHKDAKEKEGSFKANIPYSSAEAQFSKAFEETFSGGLPKSKESEWPPKQPQFGGYHNQAEKEAKWKADSDAAATIPGLKTLIDQLTKDKKQLQEEVVAACMAANEARGKTRIIEVVYTKEDGKKKKTTGIFHERFETVLKLAKARMPIFLYGPTGSGKTHLGEQLAETLGMQFAFVSCTAGLGEAHIVGRLLPREGGNFEYCEAEFIRVYENGGVFLFDEIDAADPNLLLIINTALANNKIHIPQRLEKPYAIKHKDFICMAAANTIGTGGDRMYAGRNKLDASTMDRFSVGKIRVDYDPVIESQLCPNVEIRSRLLTYRKAIEAHKLERAVTTRFLRDSYILTERFEFSLDDVDNTFFMGWRDDEKNKVKCYRHPVAVI